MASLGDLQIQATINVSDETARRCCQLLTIYATDNPNIIVVTERTRYKDGYEAWVALQECGERKTDG